MNNQLTDYSKFVNSSGTFLWSRPSEKECQIEMQMKIEIEKESKGKGKGIGKEKEGFQTQ